ncbi:hypothetical protein EDC04DRAFT_2908156 [Pisolithus marmoratus]|nr:hypothetical protein EDC04DRAFT_2908156 [Pisolithus marmoratus]
MSLSGHSQCALTDLDGLDNGESVLTHIPSIPSALSRSQTGFEELDVKWTCNHELKEKNAILEASKPQHSKKDIPPKLLAYDSKIRMLAKNITIIPQPHLEILQPSLEIPQQCLEIPQPHLEIL